MKFSNLPRSGRSATLIRVAGLGLIAAVFVGPVAANADTSDPGSGLLESVTSTVGNLLGSNSTDAAPVTPSASSSTSGYGGDGYGNGGSGYGNGSGGNSSGGNGGGSSNGGSGSGGATATDSDSSTPTSVGNSGVGSGSQVTSTVQAPITIDCNAVGILGYAASNCPTTPPDSTPSGPGTTGGPGTTNGPGTTQRPRDHSQGADHVGRRGHDACADRQHVRADRSRRRWPAAGRRCAAVRVASAPAPRGTACSTQVAHVDPGVVRTTHRVPLTPGSTVRRAG